MRKISRPNSTIESANSKKRLWSSRGLIGLFTATLLFFGGQVFLPSAQAAGIAPGIGEIRLEGKTETHNGQPVFVPDVTYKLLVPYEIAELDPKVNPLKIELTGPVAFNKNALKVPSGIQAIERLADDGKGNILIYFKNSMEEVEVQQEFLELEFSVSGTVIKSRPETIEWTGSTGPTKVIIRTPTDELANVTERFNKSGAASSNFSQFISIDNDKIVVDPKLAEQKISYTINLDTVDGAKAQTLEDTLPKGMSLDQDSFKTSLSFWDSDGLNKETTANYAIDKFALSSKGFSGTFDLPALSKFEVKYDARFTGLDLDELQKELQAAYDLVKAKEGATFQVPFVNSAIAGGKANPATHTTNIGGTTPSVQGPNIWAGFKKSTSTDSAFLPFEDDGEKRVISNLPIAVDYAIEADLRIFNKENSKTTLSADVIVTDELPAYLDWAKTSSGTVAADAITAEVNGTERVLRLASSVSSIQPGQYFISGKELIVNIGQDNTENWKIYLKTFLVSMEDLKSNSNGGTGYVTYHADNKAFFEYTTQSGKLTHNSEAGPDFTDRQPGRPEIADPSVFTKGLAQKNVEALPGQTVTLDYIFRVNAPGTNDRFDISKSKITDKIDPTVFDIYGTIDDVREKISGSYDGSTINNSFFDLSIDADGNLVIEPSTAFLTMMESRGKDRELVINLPLTTRPITGKQIVEIENSAELYGSDEITGYYTSEVVGEGSTAGSGIHVRKRVYDANQDSYSSNVRVQLDAAGVPLTQEFIYRIEITPRGESWNGKTIMPIKDVLPEELEWIGFVDSNHNSLYGAQQWIGGNLVAEWQESDRTLVITSPNGLNFWGNQSFPVYFKTSVKDLASWKEGVGITNVVGRSSTTITPSNGYPLVIQKVDSANPEKVLTDPTSRFTVTQVADENRNQLSQPVVVTTRAFVDNGILKVLDNGTVKVLTVDNPGSYTIVETKAPKGYKIGKNNSYLVTVDSAAGQLNQLTIENDPSDSKITPPKPPRPPKKIETGIIG